MAATERGGACLGVRIGALAALLCATSVRADERASVDGHLYIDTDQLEVWHPHVGLRVDASDETTVSASYDADVISSATIDVRTSASPRGFTETRHGIGADVALEPSSTLRLGGGVSGSFAPDYTSGTGSLRLSFDAPGRLHTFSVAGSVSYAGVGRVGDQRPVGDAFAGGASLGWAAVLSRVFVLDLAAAGEVASGLLSSPYRFVSIYSEHDPSARLAVPEVLPDTRLRGSLRARVRISPLDELFLRASYRLHADDWGVLGHTVEAELIVVPVAWLSVSATFRFLGQRAAGFYRGRYESLPLVPELRARDRELAATTTLGAGLVVEVRLPSVWEAEPAVFARGELIHTRLYDTPLLPERVAGVFGVGLSFSR